MSARQMLLTVGLCAVAVATGCSGVVQDSGPGTTLPPLGPTTLEGTATSASAAPPVVDGDPSAATTSTSTMPTSTTSTTTAAATTTTSAPTTSTTTTNTATAEASTTSAPSAGLVNGVSATIAGRTLSFSAACRDGQNVVLDGITWSFAGNSFRFDASADDERSAAVLIGDGFTMPMLVSSVQNGVYTYVGAPVANSVSSATVAVDHSNLPSC